MSQVLDEEPTLFDAPTSCSPEDRLAALFAPSQPRGSFDDADIEEVSMLLSRGGHHAYTSPRTYIILRIIKRIDLLERLLDEGFHDGWFPVESRGLPGFLDPSDRASIVQNQHLILTKSLTLENGNHCHFKSKDHLPFDVLSYIGHGSFGHVRKIESKITLRHYALKTVRRQAVFNNKSRQAMKDYLSEMRILKRLNHIHVVQYVGSYTDGKDLGLVMTPVADCNLGEFLQQSCVVQESHPTLRTFFGCLATALHYLHENEVRHRDIKPQNILVLKANVLLTDFGLSRDCLDTTSGLAITTPRYCAPEVAAYEKRNYSADVWSLGCVFLEMVAALQGHDVDWLKRYYEAHGTGMSHFHANHNATQKLLREWESGPANVVIPSTWIKSMLVAERRDRLSSAIIATEITASEFINGFEYSCDICCASESDSSYSESIENEEGTSSKQAESQVPTPLVLGDDPQRAIFDADFTPVPDVRQDQWVHFHTPNNTTSEGTRNAQEVNQTYNHDITSDYWYSLPIIPGGTTPTEYPPFSAVQTPTLLKYANPILSTDHQIWNDNTIMVHGSTQDYETRKRATREYNLYNWSDDAKRRAIDPNADRDNFLLSMKLPYPNFDCSVPAVGKKPRSPYYL